MFNISKIKKAIPNPQTYNCFWKKKLFFSRFSSYLWNFHFLHIFPLILSISIFIKNRFPRNNCYLFCRVFSWQVACFLLYSQLPSTYILSVSRKMSTLDFFSIWQGWFNDLLDNRDVMALNRRGGVKCLRMLFLL